MTKILSLKEGVRRHPDITANPVKVKDLISRFQPNPPTSLKALSIKMGPFKPVRDAFRFNNSFPITAEQSEQIRQRYRLVSDVVIGAAIQEVMNVLNSLSVSVPVVGGTVGLPGVVIDAVIGEVTNQLAGSILDQIAGQIPGTYGRCGGMAFAGYDFYLLDWTVDERLGTIPPADGVLGNYISSRLLDSLDLNAGKFLDWGVTLHLMPVISRVANVALGVAVGSLGGPIGAAFGALLGSNVNVFNLGGAGVIMDRTRSEWPAIKNALDEQAACPIGLVYGDSANPIDQHQILAVGYTDHSDGTANLLVWDSNDASYERTLGLDFRGDELQVNNHSNSIKGIFCEEYSFQQPPDSLHLP